MIISIGDEFGLDGCPFCKQQVCASFVGGDCPAADEGWHASIISDRVQGQWREDSYQMHDMHCVIVTNAYGKRFEHEHSFKDNRSEAEKLLKRVEAAIVKGWEPNPKHWREIQPVYGSDAYVQGGGDKVYHAV